MAERRKIDKENSSRENKERKNCFLNHKNEKVIDKNFNSRKYCDKLLRKNCHHNLRYNDYFLHHFTDDNKIKSKENNSSKSEFSNLMKDENKNRKKEKREEKNEFFKLDQNFISSNKNIENKLENFEGSARTRGFYSPKKKKFEIQNKKDSLENLKNASKLYNQRKKNFEKRSKDFNSRRKGKKYLDSINSINSCDSKILEIKKIKNLLDLSNQQLTNFNTKYSYKSNKSQSSSDYSFQNDVEKSKLSIEQFSLENNLKNKINDEKKNKEEIISKNLDHKNEIKSRISKKNKITKRKYEYSNHNNKTSQLVNFLRKLINDEDNKKIDDNSKNYKISKIDSCVKIKENIKIDSSCESSGYDSLKNIKEQTCEIINDQQSFNETNNKYEITKMKNNFLEFIKSPNFEYFKKFDNIQFIIDSKNFCLYKIYKNSEGEILLKESSNIEFNKNDYIIGKRIFKKPEELEEYPQKNELLQKNSIRELREFQNNSTQTDELFNSETFKKITRKHNWFRGKNYRKKNQRKKNYSIESTSNSSFPESSDCEQFNLPMKLKKKRQVNSSPTEKYLSHSPKSKTINTCDLKYSCMKIPENQIIMLFNSSSPEVEKNLKCLLKRNYFHLKPTLVPIPWLNLENFEFSSEKMKLNELLQVNKEENCNNFQSTATNSMSEKKLETHDQTVRKKKKSKPYFRIFKKKKK